ncbi:NAD-dependent epimerase/dehydratase family protein [Phycisphaeraceae bacterium D3-23]
MAIADWRSLHGDAFEGKRALITGGAGFIGSHLAEALIDLGAEVVVIDDLTGGDAGNFDSYKDRAGDRLRFIEGSILDEATIADAVAGCHCVFHQAAWGSVPRSVAMPDKYHAINATGTMNVLQASRAAGVSRVMFAASSSAYGDTPTLPKVETMPVRARSPYAANKAYGEALMSAWANSYAPGTHDGEPGLDTASLRYFNIFGPRQNANSAYAAVIAAFAKALLAGERPVIYGDGEQSRDFTFVDNAVHANLLAAKHDGPLKGEVHNVACGQRVTVNELAAAMARMLGRPELTPTHLDDRAGDVKHSLADLDKTRAALGYEPIVDFEQGLALTVDWYREEAVRV